MGNCIWEDYGVSILLSGRGPTKPKPPTSAHKIAAKTTTFEWQT